MIWKIISASEVAAFEPCSVTQTSDWGWHKTYNGNVIHVLGHVSPSKLWGENNDNKNTKSLWLLLVRLGQHKE